MSRGFTLLEVVVAVLLLEVAVLAAAGTLVVAARRLREAERLERVVVEAEGVLDSLSGVSAPASGARPFPGGELEWSVDGGGAVTLRATSPESGLLLEVTSAVTLRRGSP